MIKLEPLQVLAALTDNARLHEICCLSAHCSPANCSELHASTCAGYAHPAYRFVIGIGDMGGQTSRWWADEMRQLASRTTWQP